MTDNDNRELLEFLDKKFGHTERRLDGTEKNQVRAKVLGSSVPLCLFIWAVLSPKAGGYAFIDIYLAFQVCLLLIDHLKPDLDQKLWTAEERVIFSRYHLALRFPSGAKAVSRQLNGFRWIGLAFLTPLLLGNQLWFSGLILVLSFFNPLLSSLAVRLNPSLYLGDAVRRGQSRFEPELAMLMRVSDKYDRYRNEPATADTLEGALAARARGDYGAALRILQPFVEDGNAEAQSLLAGMYIDGQGVARSYTTAVKWYRKAAEQGHPGAIKKLGDIYYRGWGMPKDQAQAVKWYTSAAEKGDADAQFCLGGIIFDEQTKALLLGAPQKISESVKWYLKAADQGHADAQYSLGVLYSSDMFGTLDYVQAYKWLDLAASHFPESNAKAREKSVQGRDSIAAMMTPQQLAEARKLASEWKPVRSKKHDGKDVG